MINNLKKGKRKYTDLMSRKICFTLYEKKQNALSAPLLASYSYDTKIGEPATNPDKNLEP